MRSSYRKRNITLRTTLPDGTVLTTAQFGPDVSTQYPLGYYIEDFEYVAKLGDLDEHNGRISVTPEYPSATYAYFITLDTGLKAAYPYTLGPTYYGVVTTANIGPGSGHVTPTETVVTYSPASAVDTDPGNLGVTLYPNPASVDVNVHVTANNGVARVRVFDRLGLNVLATMQVPAGETITIPVSNLTTGVYMIRVETAHGVHAEKLVVQR